MFIDANRNNTSEGLKWGVEPICRVLQIAPSTVYAARNRPPSARTVRDSDLKPLILKTWDDNFCVYGAAKIWDQLNTDGHRVARCTVERLMADLGIRGCVRGRTFVRTTEGDDALGREG